MPARALETDALETPPLRGGWSRRVRRLVLIALVALYAVVLVRTAWISDDAYISLRTVDNFVQGYGPRWNVAERVQTYTHPLWLLLLCAAHFVTRELYLTTIVVGIAASLTAFVLLLGKLARSAFAVFTGGLALILSSTFVAYSTSGLENPLSFLLLAGFLLVFLRWKPSPRRSLALGLTAGLLLVNRLDTLMIVLPPLLFDLWQNRSWRSARMMILGITPLAAWLVFAVVYYGFPVPNSAYAKLGTGLSRLVYVKQGATYLYDALQRETLTAFVVALALVLGLFSRNGARRAIALGLVLTLLYIIWVGGTFMRSRFLTVPLFAAVGLLVHSQWLSPRRLGLMVLPLVVFLGFRAKQPTILSGPGYGKTFRLAQTNETYGIGYTREAYFQKHGLLNGKPLSDKIGHDMAALRKMQSEDHGRVKLIMTAGTHGLVSGPGIFLIDRWALGDALMARLPMVSQSYRAGHFPRIEPAGYIVSVLTGENHIRDRVVHEYYEKLRPVIRGPLFSRERWAAILWLNLGAGRTLLRSHDGYTKIGPEDYDEFVAIDVDAAGPRILWGAGRQVMRRRDLEKVRPVIVRMCKMDSKASHRNLEEAIRLAVTNKDDFDFAYGVLTLVRELKPDNANAAYSLGQLLVEQGRESEGIVHLEAAAAMNHRRALSLLQSIRATSPDG